MNTVKLKAREIPLSYKVLEMKALQEEIAPIAQLTNAIMGRESDKDKDMSLYDTPKHLENVAKAVRIMGNAWLRRNGKDQDLTDEMILDIMEPDEVSLAVVACVREINGAAESEIPPAEDEGPVDVTLEELKKKGTKGG
jgi:hypothetical protein